MAKPEWLPQRLYQWVKPRSLGLHLLFVIIAGGCLIAGWWQVNRAMQGNTLSYLYSIEWPAFAVVAGIGWWQMFHDTPDDISRRREFHRKMREASAEVVARTLPRSARALTVDSEEIPGRALGSATRRAVTAGSPPKPGSAAGAASGAEVVVAGLHPARRADDDDGTTLLPDEEQWPEDEMTEYNRYLAHLAVNGRAKTWRNPRGL